MRLTENAKQRVEWITRNYDKKVRLAVSSGGCAGFRYDFDLDDPRDEDTVIDAIHVDPISLELLRDAVVDYVVGFSGQHFKVEHPKAASSRCGCGKSFSLA